MKFTIDYTGPMNPEWMAHGEHTDWLINVMVVYRPRNAFVEDAVSSCCQLFWPANPWDELEKVS